LIQKAEGIAKISQRSGSPLPTKLKQESQLYDQSEAYHINLANLTPAQIRKTATQVMSSNNRVDTENLKQCDETNSKLSMASYKSKSKTSQHVDGLASMSSEEKLLNITTANKDTSAKKKQSTQRF